MAYRYFKDLPRRTAADNVLSNKAFSIAKKPKYDKYQRRFFDKKTSGGAVKTEIMSKQQLAEELHKPIVTKSEK